MLILCKARGTDRAVADGHKPDGGILELIGVFEELDHPVERLFPVLGIGREIGKRGLLDVRRAAMTSQSLFFRCAWSLIRSVVAPGHGRARNEAQEQDGKAVSHGRSPHSSQSLRRASIWDRDM